MDPAGDAENAADSQTVYGSSDDQKATNVAERG